MNMFFRARAMWLGIFCIMFASSVFISGCNRSCREIAQLNRDVEEVTGAHTRVVWVQDTYDRTDVFARGNQLRLMGYDSRDGRGERVILPGPGNFGKPMLLDDGETIIFSNSEDGHVYRVDWKGTETARLVKGRALEVWRDLNGVDWVFVGTERAQTRAPSYQRVTRHRMDNPSIAEHVWEGQPVGEDSFQISADGRVAAGNFPWPECGIMHIQEQRIALLGRGCWTSLAPDNSYRFWIFDGSHRNLMMFDTVSGDRTTVPVAQAPGIDGHEVYHPRWSNDPRIMAMTGPYKIRHGGNNIRGGGADVEIYIGRFREDFGSIEAWVQVTSNAYANFFPDVWVARTAEESLDEERSADAVPQDAQENVWPVSQDALLYRWEHAGAQNEIVMEQTGRRVVFRPEARERARYGWQRSMWVDHGYFVDDHVSLSVNTFSIEFLVQGLTTDTELLHIGEAFSVAIVDADWIVRAGDRQYVLGTLGSGALHHIALVVDPDSIALYVNGEEEHRAILGDPILLPETATLYWGGHPDHGYTGPDRLSHLGIYARGLAAEEISHHAVHLRSLAEASPAPRSEHLRARVVQASSIPTPEDIAPYTRALIFQEYEVVEGEREGERLLAAHWGILGGAVLADAERPLGSEHDLQLVLFDDRPELEGERVVMDNENFLLDWYYDLTL